MTTDVAALLGLLDLTALGGDVFSGESPATVMQRLYGGQVAAQSVRAAATTVDGGRTLHSLHAYFLRPGSTSSPLRYEVDRVRDSRSFSTRRVTAAQGEHVIFMLSASFAVPMRGLDHQDRAPAAVDPDRLPTLRALVATDPEAWSGIYHEWASFDLRFATDPHVGGPPGDGTVAHSQVWFKTAEPLPDDAALHASALTYVSDVAFLSTALLPHGRTPVDPDLLLASMDHALWVHRPFRVDDWLLYDQSSPSASGGLALVTGRIFDRAGALVASVVQEGLVRVG